MIKQKWKVKIEGKEYSVSYSSSPVSGRVTFEVDGDSFTVKGKPFGIGLVRREMILIGSSQGILDIQKGGHAKLICRDGEVVDL